MNDADILEDETANDTAMFYSISSTQAGFDVFVSFSDYT